MGTCPTKDLRYMRWHRAWETCPADITLIEGPDMHMVKYLVIKGKKYIFPKPDLHYVSMYPLGIFALLDDIYIYRDAWRYIDVPQDLEIRPS